MPQLLREPPDGMIFGCSGHYPLEERPALLTQVMRIITGWATLEGFVYRTFAAMLGTNAPLAAAIFRNLASTAVKNVAVRAVAQESLSKEHMALFTALLKLFGEAGKERAAVAHGIWGMSKSIPDGILLMRSQDILENHLELEAYREELIKPQPSPNGRTLPLGQIYVYKEKDLRDIVSKIEDLSGYFLLFHMMLIAPPLAAEYYTELCDVAEIRSIMARENPKAA